MLDCKQHNYLQHAPKYLRLRPNRGSPALFRILTRNNMVAGGSSPPAAPARQTTSCASPVVLDMERGEDLRRCHLKSCSMEPFLNDPSQYRRSI